MAVLEEWKEASYDFNVGTNCNCFGFSARYFFLCIKGHQFII